ncbi:hypothetical protein ACFWB1_00855 [Streptomyces goshikiensis]|uniref:hypothetical protein n=1 Tax=Streptomyces goshikiensis TaxID=1942 RepID=UPI0036966BF4
MSPELLTAIATLTGVALGIAGTLSAARIQAKGSHAQADATFRAAQTTATTQYAATLEQQNRAAQRAAYVGFLAVARDFVRRAEYTRLDGDRDQSAQDLTEPLLQVDTAYVAVELEGPEAVLVTARKFQREALEFQHFLEVRGGAYRAMNKLWAHHGDGDLREFLVIEPLDRLRSIYEQMSRNDRMRMFCSIDLVLAAGELGELGVRWRTEFMQAKSLLSSYVGAGTITELEKEIILRDAGVYDTSVGDQLGAGQDKMEATLRSFIDGARTHLNATAPRYA